MLTIVMIKWKGKRQPMALLEGKETYAKARACEYAEGGYAPRYPVPTILGPCEFYPECVIVYSHDDTPGITWWNESYGLPMPYDHGIWNPN